MTRTLHRARLGLCPTSALLALALSTCGLAAQAQAVNMAGSYGNFDVLNNTGGEACGFEMEVRGVSKSQLTRIFPSNFNAGVIRYGFGTATDVPGGVVVRWASTYDAASGRYASCTPVPQNRTTVPGDSCWTLGMPGTYATAGCEHFGISTSGAQPSSIAYRWLVDDPNNHGTLIASPVPINLPLPVWNVVQPANPALPPVVVAEIPAPPPPPARFGDAQWVKVYKTENNRQVELIELMGDNHAIVPEDPAQLEVSWTLLQADPGDGGRQRRRGKLVNQGNAGNGKHAVVRRYEFYEYAGTYDPLTHEALCADGLCNAPAANEIGNAVGAQNAAVNLNVNALSVTIGGAGSVSSGDKVFSCGNKCYGVYNPGSTVTLTAKAGSGATFAGWSGACLGNAATCTVTMNAEAAVTATFVGAAAGGGGGGGGGGGAASGFTLVVSGTNKGLVVSTPAGINCGSACSVKAAAGTVFRLSAVAAVAGQTFLGWSGACSGADPNGCTVTLNSDQKVQASFSK